MVIAKLWGGLGNQMFQYAAARRLALVNDVTLKLDLGWFANVPRGDTPRRYELHVFDTAQGIASPEEVKTLRGVDTRRWPKLAKRFLNATGVLANPSCIREKHYHFDPQILQLRGNVYLDGYWQSEKYFSDIAETIRKEFTLVPGDSRNKEMGELVASCEAVSVHVRRGDYVSNATASQHHPSSSLQYYQAALALIMEKVEHPHLFVFSDEPDWVKENLQLGVPMTCVGHNGPEKAYEDMGLMSLCKHHIIANSSFSWWGAWLALNPGKIVIAPKKWFNSEEVDTSDLIPQGWLRL